MRIGELAALGGVPTPTVRYYERRGLIMESARTRAGYRQYGPEAVRRLLDKALRDIRAGDILVAHLGIWSRKDAWAPAVLEPLITGLKQKGFCFATLRDHPDLREWIARAR